MPRNFAGNPKNTMVIPQDQFLSISIEWYSEVWWFNASQGGLILTWIYPHTYEAETKCWTVDSSVEQ